MMMPHKIRMLTRSTLTKMKMNSPALLEELPAARREDGL
jgi:hypothetical protein